MWRQLRELSPLVSLLLGQRALAQHGRLCVLSAHHLYHHYSHSTHSSRHKLEINIWRRSRLPCIRSILASLRYRILGTFIYLLFLSWLPIQSEKCSNNLLKVLMFLCITEGDEVHKTQFWTWNTSDWLHKRDSDTCFLWLPSLLLSLAICCYVIS